MPSPPLVGTGNRPLSKGEDRFKILLDRLVGMEAGGVERTTRAQQRPHRLQIAISLEEPAASVVMLVEHRAPVPRATPS